MGKIICAGLGPGDPDLISLRAHRVIRAARHVAYFRKKGRQGNARGIVDGLLAPDCTEHAMEYPVTTELPFDSPEYIAQLAAFYDDWTERLAELAAEDEVVVLCEGDPLFYGSFMHLYIRLRGRLPVEVIPGVPGMVGCWNVTGLPMTWGDDVLTILMGTLPEDTLVDQMQKADALVIMKTGRNLPRVRRALQRVGRLHEAWLVERGTMAGERIVKLDTVESVECPYFATVLVAGNGRRPEATE